MLSYTKKRTHFQGFCEASPFFNFLEKQLGYTRKEIGNTTLVEIIDYLRDCKMPPKRRMYEGVLYRAGELQLLDKKYIQLAKDKFYTYGDVQELTGQVASSGIAKGAVKVIASVNDLPKVQTGDILVSQFTRPEYVPAMKRAGAVVTNDGGITSHAAIVSRELEKPCVIGTKIATKVLKDGDVVEVDAEKGMVYKLTIDN